MSSSVWWNYNLFIPPVSNVYHSSSLTVFVSPAEVPTPWTCPTAPQRRRPYCSTSPVKRSPQTHALKLSLFPPTSSQKLTSVGKQTQNTSSRCMKKKTSLEQSWLTVCFFPAGGANVSYVRSLSASNVSMDMDTFTSLDGSVVLVSCVFVCVCVWLFLTVIY